MNNIDFEQDQREDLDSVNEAKSLSDQVVKLRNLEDEMVLKEKEFNVSTIFHCTELSLNLCLDISSRPKLPILSN